MLRLELHNLQAAYGLRRYNMAIKKAKFKPPVYDANGIASYPDTVYMETTADLVKIDDSNVELKLQEVASELSNIATREFKLKNEIVNGNFANGLNGWIGERNVPVIQENEYVRLSSEENATIRIKQDKPILNSTDTFFTKFKARTNDYTKIKFITIRYFDSTFRLYPELNDYWYNHTRILKNSPTSTYVIEVSRQAGTNYVDIDDVLLINLTQTFGAGNEPTKEEMDELVEMMGGYIDEAYDKDLMPWCLKNIRRNANKILEDVNRVEGLVGQLVGGYIKDWETGQVNISTGVDYSNTSRARTQCIEVKKGDIVKCLDTDELIGVSIFKYSLVDLTFIEQITSYTYEQAIDEDCYIRLVTRYIDDRVIEDFKILEDKFLIVKSANLIPITPAENKPFLFGDFKKLYHTLPCDDVSSTASFNLHTSTINDIYTEYDNLVTNNPHSMSKNLLGYGSDLDGLEDNSLPIYEYSIFNPQNGNRALQNNSPTILLLTGIHGEEKSSTWSALQFFKQLMSNWINDDSLSSIKGNVNFKIIPVLNPYGFNNNTRNNARNVNLNRNLSYKWNESNETDKGIAPYSELESIIVRDWLNGNNKANIFIDFHNTGESIDPSYLSTPNQTLKFIYGSVMRRLTDIWKSKYVLSMDNISYGWTTTSSIPGTANEGFHVVGIERSAVLEIAWDYNGVKYTKEVIERGVYLLANYILSMLSDYSR